MAVVGWRELMFSSMIWTNSDRTLVIEKPDGRIQAVILSTHFITMLFPPFWMVWMSNALGCLCELDGNSESTFSKLIASHAVIRLTLFPGRSRLQKQGIFKSRDAEPLQLQTGFSTKYHPSSQNKHNVNCPGRLWGVHRLVWPQL
ncbi:hypothetical protein ACJ72_05205 [Emergomyces africanus]|uniref:Uncharacterized protein n=1 Tax=Emergomyces africanus TaxID=1955775 RepID=A0A1B7NUK2_9EURO|nr:hypothetical protein ACJ72_05205 [Emergomyces africanus]